MGKLIGSADSRERLQEITNEYFYSKSYIITGDNRVYNIKLEKYLNGYAVKQVNNRWRLEKDGN